MALNTSSSAVRPNICSEVPASHMTWTFAIVDLQTTFKDLPKDYDAWNIDPGTLDHFTSIDKADSVELVGNGPLRAAIRVTHTWQSSKFVQEITLDADADQVDVVNDVDWHETHVLLKAAFPLAAASNKAT